MGQYSIYDYEKDKRNKKISKGEKHVSVMTIKDAERLKRWKKYHPQRYLDYLRQLGNFTVDGKIKHSNINGIDNRWKNEPAFIIGSSQSLIGIDLDKLIDCHTITINHTIEDWDKSEFHVFVDQRFLELTTYDLTKYEGIIFQRNNTSILKDVKRAVRFLPKRLNAYINLSITEGLLKVQSGITALHLALICGANPIYLLGCDSTTLPKQDGSHYKKGYGSRRPRTKKETAEYEEKMKRFYRYFLGFKDRIINVCDPKIALTLKGMFKSIHFDEIPKEHFKKIEKKIDDEPDFFLKLDMYKYPIDYNVAKIVDYEKLKKLNQEDRAQEFANYSIYINNGPIDYLLEAMASGMAIITLPDEKSKKILGDYAIHCKDPEGYNEKINLLLNDVSMRIIYGEGAKKRINENAEEIRGYL